MKRIWIRAAIVLAVVVAYLVGALVLPPAFHKEVHAQQLVLPDSNQGERICCIDDNTDALIWRLRLIESAREEVILSTFGFGTGQSGQDMVAALLAAAERGVEVKLLLDGLHGKKTMDQSEHLQALAAMPNVQVHIYNAINPLKPWRANYRMHDKYLIADHSMYMLGGRNTNDLFLGDYSDEPNIDRDVLVYGTGAEGSMGQLRDYFQSVWSLPVCKDYECEENEDTETVRAALRQRYRALQEKYPTAFGFTDWENKTIPANSVALLTNPVSAGNKSPQLWKQMCLYMGRGQDILIQTPYVICGDEMYEDLTALTEQGKSVTILTNTPETGANPFGCADLDNQRRNIRKTGATLLEYAGDHSIHAKAVLVDKNISIIGSFNLDMRSAYIDTETMLVIDCPALNAQLRGQMEDMAGQSLRTEPDGTEEAGKRYEEGDMGFWRSLGHGLLRLVEWPFRHLL